MSPGHDKKDRVFQAVRAACRPGGAPRRAGGRSRAAIGLALALGAAPLALAQAPASPGSVAPQALQAGTMAARLAACTACHGESGAGSADGYFPRIAGKPAEYLYNQLVNFRDGRRQYRPMQTLLANQSDDYLHAMAQWFAGQQPAYPAMRGAPAAAAARRGQTLALHGDAALGVPACTACHGATLSGVLPASPGLVGLPHDYIAAQFGAWRIGNRRAHAPDCMGEIARRLAPEDVAAVAAWLSSQPPAQAGPPEPAVRAPLPMRCGSQPNPGTAGAR
ncbi:c-type cytochrome [Orrella sp. JC864]|uniref:c-type cytochrome n=1 Tax=Orrella sp. JC864 TaxID=3120298 RepID=UPI00300A4116